MVFKRRDPTPLLTRLREAILPRRGWRRSVRYYGHRVRRLPDSPHRIALGFACGAFSSFSPFFGAHFVLAMLLAKIVRGNVLAALLGTVVGNPLTFPFIAAISLGLGRRILGYGASGENFERLTDTFAEAARGLGASLLSLFGHGAPQWRRLEPFLDYVLWPYFVGGLIPGLVTAGVCYWLLRPLVAAYQHRRLAKRHARAQERMAAAAQQAPSSTAPGRHSTADAAGGDAYNRGARAPRAEADARQDP